MIGKLLIILILLNSVVCAEHGLELIDKSTLLELKKIPLFSKALLSNDEIYYGASTDGFTVAKLCCFYVNEDGQLFIPSHVANTISVYDSTGNFVKKIELQEIGDNIKEIGYTSKEGPWNIVVDNNGNLYLLYELSTIGQYPLKGPDAYLVKYNNQGKYEKILNCKYRGYLSITNKSSIMCSQPGSYVLIDQDKGDFIEETIPDNKILYTPIGSNSKILIAKTLEQIQIKSGIIVNEYRLPDDIVNRKSYSHPIVIQENEMLLYEIEDVSGLYDYEKDPYVRIVRYRFLME